MKIKNMVLSGVFFPVCALLVLSGCGEKQAIGTGTGALVGNMISGKKSKGAGTLLGALAGNIIGSAIDQGENKEKDRKRALQQKQHMAYKKEINQLEEENQHLKRHAIRECPYHGRVHIVGAVRCPECGTKTTHLITKKHCSQCGKTYPKNAKYCAFCSSKIPLTGV
ncbi:MAG: glycine zipper 2TM domain-containing protein [bacterium]